MPPNIGAPACGINRRHSQRTTCGRLVFPGFTHPAHAAAAWLRGSIRIGLRPVAAVQCAPMPDTTDHRIEHDFLGEKAIPEFHQEDCTGPRIASALAPLLDDGSPERTKQLAALARVPQRMLLQSGTPSEAAAHIVLNYAENGRGWPRALDLSRVGA